MLAKRQNKARRLAYVSLPCTCPLPLPPVPPSCSREGEALYHPHCPAVLCFSLLLSEEGWCLWHGRWASLCPVCVSLTWRWALPSSSSTTVKLTLPTHLPSFCTHIFAFCTHTCMHLFLFENSLHRHALLLLLPPAPFRDGKDLDKKDWISSAGVIE